MSYQVGGRCENCGQSGCYDIIKGTLKEDGLKKVACPKCGVRGHISFDPYQDCG